MCGKEGTHEETADGDGSGYVYDNCIGSGVAESSRLEASGLFGVFDADGCADCRDRKRKRGAEGASGTTFPV